MIYLYIDKTHTPAMKKQQSLILHVCKQLSSLLTHQASAALQAFPFRSL